MRERAMTPGDEIDNGAMARAIADVVAKQQITEVIYRYCRGIDRMDRAMALSAFHAGAVVDFGELFQGNCTDLMDRAWAVHETMLAHSHQVSNILIELDGNRAVSESYYTAALRTLGEHESIVQLTGRGRYLDEWSCRDGRWAMDRRVVVRDFSDRRTVTDGSFAAGAVSLVDTDGSFVTASSARRDESDPSYQFFSKKINTASG
jgi:hypothetical protein